MKQQGSLGNGGDMKENYGGTETDCHLLMKLETFNCWCLVMIVFCGILNN